MAKILTLAVYHDWAVLDAWIDEQEARRREGRMPIPGKVSDYMRCRRGLHLVAYDDSEKKEVRRCRRG